MPNSHEGCTEPPFDAWITGSLDRRPGYPKEFDDGEEKDDCTMCAVIDADSEEEAWKLVQKHFPDYTERFIEKKGSNFQPGDRFKSK